MITAWWGGIPGLDARVPFGDVPFANRMAALTCAMRVLGTDPSHLDRSVLVKASNLADRFLDHFQGATTAPDASIRRLTVAIACTSMTGKPSEIRLPDRIINLAEWYGAYLAKPPDKRGSTI